MQGYVTATIFSEYVIASMLSTEEHKLNPCHISKGKVLRRNIVPQEIFYQIIVHILVLLTTEDCTLLFQA